MLRWLTLVLLMLSTSVLATTREVEIPAATDISGGASSFDIEISLRDTYGRVVPFFSDTDDDMIGGVLRITAGSADTTVTLTTQDSIAGTSYYWVNISNIDFDYTIKGIQIADEVGTLPWEDFIAAGASVDPSDIWSGRLLPSDPNNKEIIVYDGGAAAWDAVAVSGDATITTAGVVEVTEADALESNGANCSAGSAPLGVDTAGAAESCFDVWTEAENTAANYDNVSVEDGDDAGTYTTVDTTAQFDDGGDINFAHADGGAGGPDAITATVRADSVALTTDTTGNYAAGDAEAGSALTGDSATAFFSSGTVEHEYGGLETNVSAYEGILAISGGVTYELNTIGELEIAIGTTLVPGSDTQVIFNDGGTALGADTSFVWDKTSDILSLPEVRALDANGLGLYDDGGNGIFVEDEGDVGIGTLSPTSRLHADDTLNDATGNEIAYQLDYTVNKATSGDDTGLLINMTDTASPGTSLPLDIKVNGSSKFLVKENGYVFANQGIQTNQYLRFGPSSFITNYNGLFVVTNKFQVDGTGQFSFGSTADGTQDVLLRRDAANTLALRNSTNAQEFRIYNTADGAGNDEFASHGWINDANVYGIQTEAAGTGTVRDIALLGGDIGIHTTSPSNLVDVDGGAGYGVIELDGGTGGCLIVRDTDDAGWTEIYTLNGYVYSSTDADGVCDGS